MGDGEIDRGLKDRFESQEILSLSAGGQSTVGQDLLLECHLAYGSAGEREPDAYYTTFRQDDVEFDPNVGPDEIDPDNVQAHPQNEDLDEFVLEEIAVDDNDTSEEDLVGALDLSLPLAGERLLGGFLKTGVKVRSRTKERDSRTTVFDAEDDLLLADFVDRGFDPGDFLDGRYPVGPHVDPGLAAFSGERTGNTDGIALTQKSSPFFPNAALLAVHDDQGIAAFDCWDIARTLALRDDCGPR